MYAHTWMCTCVFPPFNMCRHTHTRTRTRARAHTHTRKSTRALMLSLSPWNAHAHTTPPHTYRHAGVHKKSALKHTPYQCTHARTRALMHHLPAEPKEACGRKAGTHGQVSGLHATPQVLPAHRPPACLSRDQQTQPLRPVATSTDVVNGMSRLQAYGKGPREPAATSRSAPQ